MSISRRYHAAAVAALGVVLAGSMGLSPSASAAGKATARTVTPIVLVVDTALKESGLSLAQALKGASNLLPINVTAPTYLPTGVRLFSVSVQRPVYQITRGTATLIYGSATNGVIFSLQEGASPIVLSGKTQTAVVINGAAGTLSDLGTSGRSHLVSLTWTIGKHSFSIITNTGKSNLSSSSLLKIANSISR